MATLKDLAETFGPDRRVALCRELTKLHEEVLRTTLGKAVAHYTENPPKGEFVLVVEGAAPQREEPPTLEEGLALVNRLRGGVVHPGRGEGGRQPLRPAPESPLRPGGGQPACPIKKIDSNHKGRPYLS